MPDMPTENEPARILAKGLPFRLPSWDLTDDLLDDLDKFLPASMFDAFPETADNLPPAGPALASADQQYLTDQQAGTRPETGPATRAQLDPSLTQRKLQSNRLSQARARQRKQVRFCLENL